MIRLGDRPPTPETLLSNEVLEFKESLRRRVEQGERLTKKDFYSKYWRKDDVVKALWKMHRGKCCYCERKRDMKRETDVEHFRPKAEITDYPDHPGYWWLAYDWENYLLSCKTCNQGHKKNHFPLIDNSPVYGPDDDLTEERPFLVNPAKESPEEFIGFDCGTVLGIYAKAIGLDDEGQGRRTIELLGLNKGTLPGQRAELVNTLMLIVETMYTVIRQGTESSIRQTADLADLIKENTSAGKEFAGFRRAFFKACGLGEYIAGN